MAWLLLMLLSSLVRLAVGYYDRHDVVYGDALMQDLYKRLADIDPSYFLDRHHLAADSQVYDSPRDWIDDDAAQLRSRPRSAVAGGQTDTRDSEYIGHSSNAATNGFIYMSGILLQSF